MGPIIIRNDDVSCNTRIETLAEIYDIIHEYLPDAKIWSVVSPLCKTSNNGAAYPELPLRNHDIPYFYDVDYPSHNPFSRWCNLRNYIIASHGLLHIDHSKLSLDAQKFSILTSCHMLKTKIFVPPFSQFDANTEQICNLNDIKLVKPSDGWKSLESEPFNPDHKLWFFHSWRYTPEKFREIFEGAYKSNDTLRSS